MPGLDTYFPRIFTQLVIDHLRNNTSWMPIVDDRSSELTGTATKLSYPDLKTKIAVRDYVRGTNMTSQQMEDLFYNIAIDSHKYVSCEIDSLEIRENVASVVAEWVEQAGRNLRYQVDSYLRGKFEAPIQSVTAVNQATAAETAGAAENIYKETLSLQTKAGTGDEPKWDTEGGRNALVEMLFNFAERATDLGWPEGGRFMMINSATHTQIAKYFGFDKDLFASGERNELAIRNAAIQGMVTFEPILDHRFAPEGTTGVSQYQYARTKDDVTTAGAGKNKIYFGIRGDGLRYIQNVVDAKDEEIQSQFGRRYASLLGFGAGFVDNEKRMMMDMTFATS